MAEKQEEEKRPLKEVDANQNMSLLEIIAIILLVLWLGGFVLDIAGGLIHVLLVIAIVLFLWRFIRRLI